MAGFDSFKKVRTIEANFIDHGLSSLSAACKEKGYQVGLIDLRALKGWEHFRQKVQQDDADLYGITSWSLHYRDACECVRIIKESVPHKPVIWGGVHATLNTPQLLSNSSIDYIITGEGEITFLVLLESLSDGSKPPRCVAGERPDLDRIPWADRDLFDCSGELETPMVPDLPIPFVTTNVGRGCPFKCNFCQPAERTVFGNKVRIRSPRNVVDELLYLEERFHFNSFMAHDDLFFLSPRWMMEFCDVHESSGLQKPFICQVRADLMCKFEPVVRRMAEVGFAWAMIGFESGGQRILDLFEKGTTVEQNLKAAKICRKYGIKVWANYMFGAPSETKSEVMDTVRMIWEIEPDHHSPSFFTPTPGSGMADFCEDNDLTVVGDDSSSCRTPIERKIKGVDYDFLEKAIRMAQEGNPKTARGLVKRARRVINGFVKHTWGNIPLCPTSG